MLQEENMVDYDSESVAPGGEDPKPATREFSRIAPNTFLEWWTAQALTALRASTTLDELIITKKLD